MIYIATDSHHPTEDPNLQLFFQTFPCISILSDFASIPQMKRFNKLVSEQDGLPLRKFLTPFLDAQIASKSALGFIGYALICPIRLLAHSLSTWKDKRLYLLWFHRHIKTS